MSDIPGGLGEKRSVPPPDEPSQVDDKLQPVKKKVQLMNDEIANYKERADDPNLSKAEHNSSKLVLHTHLSNIMTLTEGMNLQSIPALREEFSDWESTDAETIITRIQPKLDDLEREMNQ
ncbi:MAG: hypothetical protein MRY21_04990 [Simkaniaceae bacterium]|nr:hypothetical protein [Simkaniaceae bacterium]